MSTELARVADSDPRTLPTLADNAPSVAEQTDPRVSLPRLHQTAMRRASWLADRLAESVAERGLVALVDDQHAVNGAGELVRVGEAIRALAVLEGQERDRAERIGASMARLGLEAARDGRQHEAEVRRTAALLQAMAEECGLNWDEPETRRKAQRAILAVHYGPAQEAGGWSGQ